MRNGDFIVREAEAFLVSHGFSAWQIVDLHALAVAAIGNNRLLYDEHNVLAPGQDEAVLPSGEILVRRWMPPIATREALARALGNWILGHHVVRASLWEAKATIAASYLLMPKHAFTVMRRRLGDDVKWIAHAFRVRDEIVLQRFDPNYADTTLLRAMRAQKQGAEHLREG